MYTTQAFDRMIARFQAIQSGPHQRMTDMKRLVKRVRHTKASNLYWERNPEKVVTQFRNPFSENSRRKFNREFFMKNADDILSANGDELEALAEHFEIDQNLPTQEKQEQVLQVMADTYIHGDPAWTREKIARDKKHFLATIEKSHFVNLTCSLLNIKESTVRTWMRTDPDFSDGVHAAQIRFGERVAHATLAKALNGDLGAQMYVLKQFGDSVNFIEPEAVEHAASVGIQVDNLTSEEQETLLRLMRKAQEGTSVVSPTKFVEYDESVPVTTKFEENAPVLVDDTVPTKQEIIDFCGD